MPSPETTATLPHGLTVRSRSVGPMDNISYLISDADGVAVLIDAANDMDSLRQYIRDVQLHTIITTHKHPDHWQALGELAEETGAQLVSGAPDRTAISAGAGVEVNHGLWDGDRVTVGGIDLEVIGLVGHTPGGITLVLECPGEPTRLFTGDSLFPGGVGKTPNPEAFTELMDGVEQKLFARFDDDTVVLPGHGLPTTLGTERPHLAEWRDRGW